MGNRNVDGMNIADMSASQLECVFDAVIAATDLLVGRYNMPQTWIVGGTSDDNEMPDTTPVSEAIEALLVGLEMHMTAIVNEARSRKPNSSHEREARARLLLKYDLYCGECPAVAENLVFDDAGECVAALH